MELNGAPMFFEKVRNQKYELETARLINEKLKNKYGVLHEETSKLRQQLSINRERTRSSSKEFLLNFDELTLQRHKNFALDEEYKATAKKLAEVEEKFAEKYGDYFADKKLDEQLEFKRKVEECLQEMLFKVRLQDAEDNAAIKQLRADFAKLQTELAIIKSDMKADESVSNLQEELLMTKQHAQNVQFEFVKLKKEIRNLKAEMQEALNNDGEDDGEEMAISLKFWTSKEEQLLKDEIASSASKTQQWQDEIVYLEYQVKLLSNRHSYHQTYLKSNEELERKLDELAREAAVSYNKKMEEIEGLQVKYNLMQSEMDFKLDGVEQSKCDKSSDLCVLQEKTESLENSINLEEMAPSCENSEVEVLEEEVLRLEQKIQELNDKNFEKGD